MSKGKREPKPYTVRLSTDVEVRNRSGSTTWSSYGPHIYNRAKIRPNNVHNPMDATGWRKPSRFSTEPDSWGPYLFGHVDKARFHYYPPHDSWHRDVDIKQGLVTYRGFATSFQAPSSQIPALWSMPLHDIYGRITWEMENAVLVKAIASLANRKGKVLETFAELRSSVMGLAANAQEISWFIENHRDREALRRKFNLPRKHPALKRMRKIAQTAKGATEFFGKQWLNFWFGLSPIVDEMVFTTLILSDPEMFQRLRVKGTGHVFKVEELLSTRNFSAVTGVVFPTPAWRCTTKLQLKVGVRVSAFYDVKCETIASLKQYGLIDVASTAWALAPLSWMVDWVIPVTKLLESYEGLAGLSYKGATITRYYEITPKEMTGSMTSGYPWTQVSGEIKLTPHLLGGKGFRRDILLPMGMYPAPYFKDPLSVWTATTALSFMAQKLKHVLNVK